jgi:hypothetical protein
MTTAHDGDKPHADGDGDGDESSSVLTLADGDGEECSTLTASWTAGLGRLLSRFRRAEAASRGGGGDGDGDGADETASEREAEDLRAALAESRRENGRLQAQNKLLAARLAAVEKTLRDERDAARPEREEIVKSNDSLRQVAMSATERSEMAERRARYMRRHVTEQLVARPRSRSRRPRSAAERRRDTRALEERVRALESRLHTADDETRTVLWRKGFS